jgi:hypothetical protein
MPLASDPRQQNPSAQGMSGAMIASVLGGAGFGTEQVFPLCLIGSPPAKSDRDGHR